MNNVIFGVYALVFPNSKVYIGSSVKSCEIRHRSHLRRLRKGIHRNKHMQRLFNKYGEPEFRILQICGDPKGMKIKEIIIRIREQAWIKDQGVDAINCGPAYPNAMYGMHHSVGTIKKLSEAWRNRVVSEETRKKMSMLHTGMHCSEETRRKMSESKKGKKRSDETRKKMSEAQKGNTHWLGKHHSKKARKAISEALKGNTYSRGHIPSEETKKKMSESKMGNQHGKGNISMLGKHHSEETKKKMSESQKNRWRTIGRNDVES